jgi:DNA-binding transcriptional regulator GbsR (MarR family)
MNKEILPLADSVGEFIQYWGFKSIHGRVWTLIYLSDQPISTPQIVETLGVSKGLTSMAINELMELELIEQLDKAKYGVHTYISKEDIASTVRNVLRERELVYIKEAQNKMEVLLSKSDSELNKSNINKKRLKSLRDLTHSHRLLLSKVVGHNFKSVRDWLDTIKFGIKFFR